MRKKDGVNLWREGDLGGELQECNVAVGVQCDLFDLVVCRVGLTRCCVVVLPQTNREIVFGFKLS